MTSGDRGEESLRATVLNNLGNAFDAVGDRTAAAAARARAASVTAEINAMTQKRFSR